MPLLIELFHQYGIPLSPRQEEQFEQFLTLFRDYNTHTNLSAIRDEPGIIEKHFIDSLQGVSLIRDFGEHHNHSLRLLDIGSGGGFPGIPLKIILPELQVTLLDSVGKKIRALDSFITNLHLEDTRTFLGRAETIGKDPEHRGQYDIVVSRATAYVTDLIPWSLPFLTRDGILLLYKTPSGEELADMQKILSHLSLRQKSVIEYELAGQKRHIYEIVRKC